MTPFTYLAPWSQQPSLNKKVCLSRYEKQDLGLPNPSPKLHLKYMSGVMTSRVGHTTNQPFGMHLRHAHVPASSPCLPPLSGSSFFNPKVGVRFWFEPTQDGSICPMPFDNLICTYTKNFMIQSLGSFKALLFHLQLDVIHFYVTLCPTKRKVMSSSRSTSLLYRSRVEFFYGFFGMFHVGFIHPRSLYWMVSFPLD